MKHDFVQACDLKPGMVIVPPLRTMRHAVVEGFKSTGGYAKDMRNHATDYVIVKTDIGLKSYEALAGVNVLVPGGTA